jgi:hypothetical protein
VHQITCNFFLGALTTLKLGVNSGRIGAHRFRIPSCALCAKRGLFALLL